MSDTAKDPQVFKIDRSQRMHSNGVVVRVYQVFGAAQFGWDTNRGESAGVRPYQESCEEAERDADATIRGWGHACDDGCYSWRSLG